MEDEARWMIKNNLVNEKDVPNFLDYIRRRSQSNTAPGGDYHSLKGGTMRRNQSPRRFSLVTTILVVLVTVFGSWSCTDSDRSGSLETITIAVPPLEQNALLYVADQKRFFADHGLQVVIKDYDSGVTAISAMFKSVKPEAVNIIR